MTHDSSTPPAGAAPAETPVTRRVLLWRPESEETEVRSGVDEVAAFLNVEPVAVVAAIKSGDLLAGWFVDWQVMN